MSPELMKELAIQHAKTKLAEMDKKRNDIKLEIHKLEKEENDILCNYRRLRSDLETLMYIK
jgi:cell division protein FtsB